ncbi:MAG: hypothetical protein ACRD3L_09275 [Terriglobales bacterium]
MNLKTWRRGFSILLLIALLGLGSSFGFAREKRKETIRATAMGTGTQMGQNVNVTLIIFDYSTPEERTSLVDAFQKGKNQGLVEALNKMRPVGRCMTTRTMGYDVGFIRVIPTATGRKIRFLTNRRIGNLEAITNSLTETYNLTAGEINVDGTNKDKSTGFIYPAARLVINKEGEFQFELNQNAWNLINILVLK